MLTDTCTTAALWSLSAAGYARHRQQQVGLRHASRQQRSHHHLRYLPCRTNHLQQQQQLLVARVAGAGRQHQHPHPQMNLARLGAGGQQRGAAGGQQQLLPVNLSSKQGVGLGAAGHNNNKQQQHHSNSTQQQQHRHPRCLQKRMRHPHRRRHPLRHPVGQLQLGLPGA